MSKNQFKNLEALKQEFIKTCDHEPRDGHENTVQIISSIAISIIEALEKDLSQ